MAVATGHGMRCPGTPPRRRVLAPQLTGTPPARCRRFATAGLDLGRQGAKHIEAGKPTLADISAAAADMRADHIVFDSTCSKSESALCQDQRETVQCDAQDGLAPMWSKYAPLSTEDVEYASELPFEDRAIFLDVVRRSPSREPAWARCSANVQATSMVFPQALGSKEPLPIPSTPPPAQRELGWHGTGTPHTSECRSAARAWNSEHRAVVDCVVDVPTSAKRCRSPSEEVAPLELRSDHPREKARPADRTLREVVPHWCKMGILERERRSLHRRTSRT